MENDQIRKKVYMQTHRSSLINPRPTLTPQWLSENQLGFASAYEFCTYNAEGETTELLPRGQGQNEALLAQFKPDASEHQNELYYIYKEKQSFYLAHHHQEATPRTLLFKRDGEQKSKIVEKFLDYIISNKDEPIFSSRNILTRTQKLIEEYKQDQREEECEYLYDLEKISNFTVIFQCNFALAITEMKNVNGVMLVNLSRLQKQTEKEYQCLFATVDLNRCEQQLAQSENLSSRVIYLFPQKLLQVHRTTDITKFVFLTENYLLLVKINYELMELCLLHKIKTSRPRSRLASAAVNRIGDEQYVTGVVETRVGSCKNVKEKGRRMLKLFRIFDRTLHELKTQQNYLNAPRYEFCQGRTLKFLDDSHKNLNIKFSSKVIESHYEISDSQPQEVGLTNNIMMSVFNNMLSEQGRYKQKTILDSESKRNNLFVNQQKDMSESTVVTERTIKEIAGIAANNNMIVIWEKEEAVMHLLRVISPREIEQRHQKNKQAQMNKTSNKILMKDRQIKYMYAQLMGNTPPPKQETMIDLDSRIEYLKRVELDLSCHHIARVVLSPGNYNLLVIASSGGEAKENFNYWVFQLELFTQLSNPDANMFLKPLRHIHKNKSTEYIATSFVRQLPIFLTGNLVHSMQGELIEGALSFDIHPYHLFLAVSFGFTTKIYVMEGTERLSSLHTINLQGVKQVRYSPLGNHLCLLLSKCIRILDAYSFMLVFTIHEKHSSFAKCSFSSDGMELHTLSENHVANVYNIFDYTKIDSIKLSGNGGEAKACMMASFLKNSQYCLVLQNGSIVVRCKAEAVVLTHQQSTYRYLDSQKITCIQIDQRNGILFVGCSSGKLRAHIWPMKNQQSFDTYSEIRIGFTPILSLALSHLSYYLYIGCQNGNVSKVKFVIDRDRGVVGKGNNTPHPLFTDSSLKYISMSGNSNIEKVYKYVLVNSSSVNQELPEKIRLEFKLSQVISKLNEEMHKLKSQIKGEIEEKMKMNTDRFDIDLYHHLNKMITTKLATQYNEEQDSNHREIESLKEKNSRQINEFLTLQNELMKEKCLLVSKNAAQRNKLKKDNENQLQRLFKKFEQQIQKLQNRVGFNQKKAFCDEDEIFFLPSTSYDYQQQKNRLSQQLQAQNKQYYQLRKQCTYKEAAIKGMNSKKIKEQSLQFKFELQTTEMRNKYEYNKGVAAKLKVEIEEAQEKVHVIQAQASVIKSNAQFKKVANLEEMNDACSYKLWVKEKTEKEIHELCVHLRQLEEFLQGKSSEMVDLIVSKGEKQGQIKALSKQRMEKKHLLKISKLALLNSKNKVQNMTKNDQSALLSAHLTPGAEMSATAASSPSSRPLTKAHSSRQMVNRNKDVTLFNSIMDKQMNFLKTTMKIHKRKIKNFGKENGELLTEYQKLKYENRNLMEIQRKESRDVHTLKKDIKAVWGVDTERLSRNVSVEVIKTSFQKYLQNKSSKMGYSSKFKTATNTPHRAHSPQNKD